jgi:hypothetical protein
MEVQHGAVWGGFAGVEPFSGLSLICINVASHNDHH